MKRVPALITAGLALIISTVACDDSARVVFTATPVHTPGSIPVPTDTPTPGLVPAGYYDRPCQQPENTTLREWLGDLPWYGEINVSGGGWDCSQISAYVEWLAENCGYSVVFTGRKGAAGSSGHVWLTVEGDPYEASGLYWIDYDTADPGYYEANVWFENIYEAMKYTGNNETLTAAGEWGWYVTYPELYK